MAELVALSGRTKISQELSGLIAQRLVSGEFGEDAVLPSEVELAEQYQVSRPIAREAVQHLAYAGMLRVQHGKRTMVRAAKWWNVLAPVVQEAYERTGRGDELRALLYEVRLVLETACAGYAATRAESDERAEIAATCAAGLAGADAGEPVGDFLARDRVFHELVALSSGNHALRQLTLDVQGYLTSSWDASNLRQPDMRVAAEQHAGIGAAIQAGDAERARTLMASHIDWAAGIESAPPEDGVA